MRKIAILLAAAASIAAAPAMATTLTFDSSLASYTPLGITFDSNFGTLNDTFGGAVVVPGAPNYATLNGANGTISFTSPTKTVFFDVLGLNAGGGFYDGATLTAFNSAGIAIQSQTITPAGPNQYRSTYSFGFTPAGGDIKTIEFARLPNLSAGSSGIFGFDNLTFDTAVAAVPEPATWAMMLAGFGMIGFAARRRQSVKTAVTYA